MRKNSIGKCQVKQIGSEEGVEISDRRMLDGLGHEGITVLDLLQYVV
jgi:hypothetical protein